MSEPSFQRILVPTDLSDFAVPALRWAAMLERRLGASLTVLFANQPYIPFDVMEGPAAYALQNTPDFRERLARDLRDYVATHLPGLAPRVETRVVDDAPARAILDAAKDLDADLIVMATHGRSGWQRVLLGSVTERVVHLADRPVLCIPPDTGHRGQPAIGKILCPVNFTDIARTALETAAGMAEAFDAELLVAHIAETGDDADLSHDFEAWIEPHVRSRCRYSRLVASGDAAEETLRLADDAAADLIVVGAQHRRFKDLTVLGTTTQRVVRFARRPVLTVTAPGAVFAKRLAVA